MDDNNGFIKKVKHPLFFRIFLLSRLPAAFFSGLKIAAFDETTCTVSVPYKWFSKNPFNSTYFACLAMAAEMSTGALAMAHLYKRKPRISMLVTAFTITYHKKARARSFFSCTDGQQIKLAIEMALATGEPQSITATATGKNSDGELIATAQITWSFLSKKENGRPVN